MPSTHMHARVYVCVCMCTHACIYARPYTDTVMHRLTAGIHYEKWVFRRFLHCANVMERTYTNLDSKACYTPRLYGLVYCS